MALQKERCRLWSTHKPHLSCKDSEMNLAWNIKITIAIGKPSDGKPLAWKSTDYTKEQRVKTQRWISSTECPFIAEHQGRAGRVPRRERRGVRDSLRRREGWRTRGAPPQLQVTRGGGFGAVSFYCGHAGLLRSWMSAIFKLIKLLAQTAPAGNLFQRLAAFPLWKHQLKFTDGQFRQI